MEVPRLSLAKFDKNPMCFGCGKDNPHSLKMRFYKDGEVAKSEFIPTEYHQGWPGHVHGGALLAAIDESIGWATYQNNIFSVTAKIDVRLRSMARIGEPLTLISRVSKQTSRTIEVDVQVRRQDDSIVAEASSVQFIVR